MPFEPIGRQFDAIGPSAWGVAADRLDLNTLLMGLVPDKAQSSSSSANPKIWWCQDMSYENLTDNARSILMYPIVFPLLGVVLLCVGCCFTFLFYLNLPVGFMDL
jgi:hypothetical protein